MLSDKTQNALNGVAKATLKSGVRVKHLYRFMTHFTDLWMQAYANIHANAGALTKGVDETTLDGFGEERVIGIMKKLTDGTYAPKPSRRKYIPKANGKKRPLGVPSGDDKLVQEVVRMLLEQIFEPTFSDQSHGFRTRRSCHTALTQVVQKWKGTKWVIDVDISGFYDNINHDRLIEILEKKIDDKRFISLIRQLLEAGYLEGWKHHKTYSGTPQGGICSPILANIYLNEMDLFIANLIQEFNKGEARKGSLEYNKKQYHIQKAKAELQTADDVGGMFPWFKEYLNEHVERLETERRRMPFGDPLDPNYRKLYYVRYADDFAIGIIGSKADAEIVQEKVKTFLEQNLKLSINTEKSSISHIGDGFKFLGHHLYFKPAKRVRRLKCGVNEDGTNYYGTVRTIKSQISLQLPKEKVWAFCHEKKYLKHGGRPTSRGYLLDYTDYEIVETYNSEMRGYANYYGLAPAGNLYILEWAALNSLWKTLARKHQTTACRMRNSMKIGDDHYLRYEVKGQKKMLRVFKIKHRARICGSDKKPPSKMFHGKNVEILERLSANQCEYCATKQGPFQVHHVRRLKDLKQKTHKLDWEKRMCARNRKTMVLCHTCHVDLHNGKLPAWKRDYYAKMESRMQ